MQRNKQNKTADEGLCVILYAVRPISFVCKTYLTYLIVLHLFISYKLSYAQGIFLYMRSMFCCSYGKS